MPAMREGFPSQRQSYNKRKKASLTQAGKTDSASEVIFRIHSPDAARAVAYIAVKDIPVAVLQAARNAVKLNPVASRSLSRRVSSSADLFLR